MDPCTENVTPFIKVLCGQSLVVIIDSAATAAAE
jgi:hypothetical protein